MSFFTVLQRYTIKMRCQQYFSLLCRDKNSYFCNFIMHPFKLTLMRHRFFTCILLIFAVSMTAWGQETANKKILKLRDKAKDQTDKKTPFIIRQKAFPCSVL